MRAFCHVGAVAVAAMALGITAEGQSSDPCTLGVRPSIGFGMNSYRTGGSVAPFSGIVKSTFEQKLADGNSIHGVMRTRQARDSTGKTRTEFAQGCERGEDGQPQEMLNVSVFDPILKTTMNWQVNQFAMPKVVRIVHQNEVPVKQPSPEELAERQKIAQVRQPSKEEFRTENLGTKSFHGVTAQGSRKVRTIPAGEEGNDLPLEVVEEYWVSKQLGLAVMIVRDDPRQGRTTAEFEELNVGEPDPALFAVPAGYKVEDVHPNVVAAIGPQ